MHMALKAFHCPFRLRSIELPCVGWVKYAEVFPLREESWATRTYPAGAADDCEVDVEVCEEADVVWPPADKDCEDEDALDAP